MKTLKFQHDDVIICDVSGDFRILCGMWNKLVMSFLFRKISLSYDRYLHVIHAFFMYVFCNFSTSGQGFSIMTSLSMTAQPY